MTKESQKYDLAGLVIGSAMEVHRELGEGFNETVYKNALAFELRSHGFTVEIEKKITVYYKTEPVGHYSADLVVNERLIVELKAVITLNEAHEAQLVNYLKATGIQQGLLINFGSSSLQFKKKYKNYSPSKQEPPRLQS